MALERWHTHRRGRGEAFLTNAEAVGDVMTASGRVPAGHSRMPDPRGGLPEMLALEIIRQAGFFTAHAAIGVPFGWHLVTTRLALTWQRDAPRVSKNTPFRFDVTGRVERLTKDALHFRAELEHKQQIIAVGTIEALSIAPDRYRALRRRSLSSPAAPHHVTGSPLGELTKDGWMVRWNDQDPFLFNRPGDHVVSMALIDAVLAGARLRAPCVVSLDMRFLRFAERDGTITLKAAGDQFHDGKTWEIRQGGEIIARASTRPFPAARSTPSGIDDRPSAE